jgi:hypothetical protein
MNTSITGGAEGWRISRYPGVTYHCIENGFPIGKTTAAAAVSATQKLRIWENYSLGTAVYYRFLLNLYSTPTEMAKLTSNWEYAVG